MSHIPLHTEIMFYEIDLKNYLDEENYKKFDYEVNVDYTLDERFQIEIKKRKN